MFEGAMKSKKTLISRGIRTPRPHQPTQAHHSSQPGDSWPQDTLVSPDTTPFPAIQNVAHS